MSVLIPGIDMPDSCDNCFICNRCEGNCDISDADYLPNKRPDDCPLIEIPPHGRLIDADAFLARNEYFADREFVNPKYDDTLKDLIDRADTIIPADPEGGANDG